MNTVGAAASNMGAYMFIYVYNALLHTHNVYKNNEYQKHLCQDFKINTFITYCVLPHCRKHLPYTYIFENEQAYILQQ